MGGIKNVHSERARHARAHGELVLVNGSSAVPSAPNSLRSSGRAIWDVAWETPWTCDSDASAIKALAELEDELVEYQAQVAADGLTHERILTSARGDVVGSTLESHPLLVEIRRGRTLANSLRRELGLTPVSRARLGIAVVEGAKAQTDLERLTEARAERRGAA